MKITRGTINHLDDLADLFDQYRQFYEQDADFEGCKEYLHERLTNDESIIFIAQGDEGEAIGFTQLYSSFCSVARQPTLYLYDLYVSPNARRQGVGRALMKGATEYAKEHNAVRLSLQTAHDNASAQALYESLGYEKDTHFFAYDLSL